MAGSGVSGGRVSAGTAAADYETLPLLCGSQRLAQAETIPLRMNRFPPRSICAVISQRYSSVVANRPQGGHILEQCFINPGLSVEAVIAIAFHVPGSSLLGNL